MKYAIGLSALVFVGFAVTVQAQHSGRGGHADRAHTAVAKESAATRAYRAVNEKMHADMSLKYSGDADVDFLHGMIPHHQGAIDMAKVVLEHGKDARVRKLAEEIIRAQEQEIADMRKWLAEMGR